MTTNAFLKHDVCPQCRENGRDKSGNNLGVWEDGHKWCFSCGYHINPEKGNNYVRRKLTEEVISSAVGVVNLPSDAGHDIALEAIVWIRKYDLTLDEIRSNNFLWSQGRRLLVMPVYHPDTKVLLYWQGKHFNESIASKMKYQTFGNPSNHIEEIGNREGDTIVLVEDKVSAIKVGRVITAMPLYGSSTNLAQVIELSKRYARCILWLDRDKLKHSMDMKDWMSVYFQEVKVVSTEADPKAYDEQSIMNAVGKDEDRPEIWTDAIKLLNRRAKEEILEDDTMEDRYRKWDGRS